MGNNRLHSNHSDDNDNDNDDDDDDDDDESRCSSSSNRSSIISTWSTRSNLRESM